MATLYVASTETFSGKSALCAGLAKRLQRDGMRIGYLKPVSTGARLAAGLVDEDAEFFKQTFGLPDSLEDMVPIGIVPRTVEALLRGQEEPDFAATLHAAYGRIAAGRDVVILEGGGNLRQGRLVGLPANRVAEMLDASALVVVKYSDDLQVLDDALAAQEHLGQSLIGVVLNAIPRQRMPFVQELVKPELEKRGVRVLAVLPQ
jgi:BioD-like phosphotransacetylase family protein